MNGDRNSVISTRDLLVVFARSLFLQSAWSFDRMQTVGFAYAMEPALRKLYRDPAEYEARLRVHLEYFNTQPYFASFVIGASLRIEQDRSNGRASSDSDVADLKTSLMAPLGALGDSFFWGALNPLAAVVSAAVYLTGSWWAPILFLAMFNFWHIGLRIGMLFWGFRSGGDAVALLSRYRFTSMARRFKMLSLSILGGLLGLFPLWRSEFGFSLPAPRLVVLISVLTGVLVLVAATRRGGSPVKLMLALALSCLILAYAGVV